MSAKYIVEKHNTSVPSTTIRPRRLSREEIVSSRERERIISDYMGLATAIAKKTPIYGGFIGCDHDDLEAVGFNAIVEAVNMYDPITYKNVPIGAFISQKIRFRIQDEIRKRRNGIATKSFQWVGFDSPISAENNNITVAEVLPDYSTDIENSVVNNTVLNSMIDTMPEPHRTIMYMRVIQNMSVDDISLKMHVGEPTLFSYIKEAQRYFKAYLNDDQETIKDFVKMVEKRRKKKQCQWN